MQSKTFVLLRIPLCLHLISFHRTGADQGSIQEIAMRCNVVFAMVFDDAAVRSLFNQYMEVLDQALHN